MPRRRKAERREGYVLTVLAPNDEAMAKLTTDQLSEPGAPEQIMCYHLIPEYQTEESMYNAVRRFGKVKYDTLRLPHKVVVEEADGSVKFGQGKRSAYLFDPDIYTDGRISVQGIDGVLFPPEEKKVTPKVVSVSKVVSKPRREIEMMKERFAKLLLGEDMSGGGKGVCTALAISNNLSATVFGELWRLEPLAPQMKAVWCRKMECLLSVSDSIVELGVDVGHAILESYSRVMESLAFNIIARIDDVLYVDDATKRCAAAESMFIFNRGGGFNGLPIHKKMSPSPFSIQHMYGFTVEGFGTGMSIFN